MAKPINLLQPIAQFLAKVPSFAGLPPDVHMGLARTCLVDYHEKGARIMVQGETRIDHLFIIHRGAVQLSYDSDPTLPPDLLAEGGLYGGLSLLRNEGLSLRTAVTLEDTFLYLIPKKVFFQLCDDYPSLRDSFYNGYHKHALERSLTAMRRRRVSPSAPLDEVIMHLQVGRVMNREVTRTIPEVSLQQVATLMTQKNTGYVLVEAEGALLGIVTDSDLRREVVAGALLKSEPVSNLMKHPVLTLDLEKTTLEALILMRKHHITYLPICEGGTVVGILSSLELPQVQAKSPLHTLNQITQTQQPESLTKLKASWPRTVADLFREGFAVEQISRFIADLNDALLERLVQLAQDQLGPAPCPFTFLVLGSEGRAEQTLTVDQDNAILFADDAPEQASNYFLNLGTLVCNWLDQAGFPYCKGQVMAINPQWNQPLAQWKRTFSDWIRNPDPKNLMHARIFFDFRAVAGDRSLALSLQDHLMSSLRGRTDLFFRNMVEHHLKGRPPLGFFRNFAVVTKGEHKDVLDIKTVMNFLVDYARIRCLFLQIPQQNSLDRLHELKRLGHLNAAMHEELQRAYLFMMNLRFHHQLDCLDLGEPPNNYINPFKLSPLDQEILKAVFRLVAKAQRQLASEFGLNV